jgi:carbamoyl-phosphate synthase large subunit
MKSVGEAMAIGRTFRESLHKAIRSLETGSFGFEGRDEEDIESRIAVANSQRPWYLAEALRRGWSVEKIHDLSGIDPWFLRNLEMIIEVEGELTAAGDKLDRDLLARARRDGFADVRVAALTGLPVEEVAAMRARWGLKPAYKTVDTCAAEFEAFTPYLYATSEEEDEAPPSDRRKIVILGGGPNRIGQGIEFDYCCVHASFALKEAGYETIMINCNPETVSTDYDTSDRLYFEPLTHEDVLAIVQREKPDGVIVQFGGQTPLGLARGLEAAGVPVIGTSPDSIDLAEDRERFQALLEKLELKQPPGGIARSVDEAEKVALSLGLPVLVRPSYVLGGRGMQIVYEESQLREFAARAMESSPGHPLLIDKFLNQAIEVDVDSVCDGERVVIGGIMEHIEQAGVHSGDSACSLPPWSLAADVIEEISRQTRLLALEIGVLGLMNVQFAVVGSEVFILEVNPRASRTVPFVSKATGVQLAKIAARVMAGESLVELGFTEQVIPPYVSVKEAVFPFLKFAGVDTLLGPEMKSTGEVMGIAPTFGEAFAKAQLAGGTRLPTGGTALVSVRSEDKVFLEPVARSLVESGLDLVATSGTADYLRGLGIDCEGINKVYEGSPHTVDIIEEGRVQLVVNTSSTPQSVKDSYSLRRSALERGVPYFTTPAGAAAAAAAIAVLKTKSTPTVYALQDLHAELPGRGEAG